MSNDSETSDDSESIDGIIMECETDDNEDDNENSNNDIWVFPYRFEPELACSRVRLQIKST